MSDIIQVAASGDLHYDATSRWDECLRVNNWIADDCTARGVNLFVIPGDWYERNSKAVERFAVKEMLKRHAAERPVIGVRGNHDTLLDLDIYNDLRSRWPIVVEEGAKVHLVQIGRGLPDVAVACVAWPQKAQLLSMLKRDVSHEGSERAAREQLRLLMMILRDQLAAHPGPRILAMHAMVRGSTTSTGQPLTGCDLEVTLEELALTEADIILLSHVHKPQQWEVNGIPIIYCGSPYATAYGEVEDKSYVVAEFNPTRDSNGKILRAWHRVPTPRTSMVLVNARYMPETGQFYYLDDVVFDYAMAKGSDVRFRYTVDSEFAEAAATAAKRLEADLRNSGAVELKIDPVLNSTTRARAPEVVTAQTYDQKLEVLWKIRAQEIQDAQRQRLFPKVHQIETELRETSV